MNRIAVVVGLLVATAALARAQDEAVAKEAVARAREALQAFDGVELEMQVDVEARRSRFLAALDGAQAAADLLDAGPARDIAGHSINRLAIDALFARAVRTSGLNREMDLIHLDDACGRLDAAVLGEDARAVERAVRKVHHAVTWSRPWYNGTRADYDAPSALETMYDDAAHALRDLLPRQKRYAQLLGTRLSSVVRQWRRVTRIEWRYTPEQQYRESSLAALGTIVDKAWLDARLPPFLTQRSNLIRGGFSRSDPRSLEWFVQFQGNVSASCEVELIAPDGRLVSRGYGSERAHVRLAVPAGTAGDGHIVLVTYKERSGGAIHTTAYRVTPEQLAQAAPAEPSASVGLTGALNR